MTIWQRLNTALLLLGLLLLAGFGLAVWVAEVRAQAERRGSQLAASQNQIQNDAIRLSEALRGLLLDPKSDRQRKQRSEFAAAESDLVTTLEALPATFDDDPELLRSAAELRGFTQRTLLPFYHRVLDTGEAEPAGAAADYIKNQAAIHEQREELFADLKRQVDRVGASETGRAQTIFVAGMGGVALILVAGVLVARFQTSSVAGDLLELAGQVRQSGSQVDATATQIAATTRRQQSAADEIAATSAQVGATSKQLSATSLELVKTLNEANRAAEQTASLAGNGQSALDRVDATLRQILDASVSITAKLAALHEKTANINSVAVNITKVADQTNLLSLNAAIEAEKAGEYGLGFAVVAMEIRRLADQSAVAAYDLEKIVKEMQSAVAAGVAGMDKFADEVRRGGGELREVGVHLAHINQQTQTLTPRFQTVHDGVNAQATGARQIGDTLTQLSATASQTAEALRQSQTAIEQLNGAARGLQTSVARFKLDNHS